MVGTCLISAKNRWILPKSIKESVDLPDFCKESVTQIQILCTFQAHLARNPCTRDQPAYPRTRDQPVPRAPARSQPVLTPNVSAGA